MSFGFPNLTQQHPLLLLYPPIFNHKKTRFYFVFFLYVRTFHHSRTRIGSLEHKKLRGRTMKWWFNVSFSYVQHLLWLWCVNGYNCDKMHVQRPSLQQKNTFPFPTCLQVPLNTDSLLVFVLKQIRRNALCCCFLLVSVSIHVYTNVKWTVSFSMLATNTLKYVYVHLYHRQHWRICTRDYWSHNTSTVPQHPLHVRMNGKLHLTLTSYHRNGLSVSCTYNIDDNTTDAINGEKEMNVLHVLRTCLCVSYTRTFIDNHRIFPCHTIIECYLYAWMTELECVFWDFHAWFAWKILLDHKKKENRRR